jgi:uncharacterized protein (DUF2252 family)
LEFKQARRSALAGLAPPSQKDSDGAAQRVVTAHAVHLVGGDPFYGKAQVDDTEHLVHERSPYKNKLDLSNLESKDWKKYAFQCGRVLAQAHARSDSDSDPQDSEVESRILCSMVDANLFVHDMLEFAKEAFARLQRDHAYFKREHDLGAFRFSDSRWA